tara:strand:+ start:3461 stop:4417 length:957 start_codon:yes stop_codon:yes gene_type:complete
MKGLFITILILGGIAAAGYFFWEPYIEPAIKGYGPRMTDGSVIKEDSSEKGSVVGAGNDQMDSKPAVSTANTANASQPSAPKKSDIDLLLEERYPMPDILPLKEIVGNWANVPDRAFPPEIRCSEPVMFELVVNGQVVGGSSVDPGIPLKPVRLIGDQLVVSSLANATMSNQVSVDKTDFKQRITKRYDDFAARKIAEVDEMRAKVKRIVEADPAKLALLKGESSPPVAAASATDSRFTPVKKSIVNGALATVKPEETKSFFWNGTQTVGGAYPGTYDTVTVLFEVETIFGKFPVKYKALIKGGQVIGWIDPFTEDRI